MLFLFRAAKNWFLPTISCSWKVQVRSTVRGLQKTLTLGIWGVFPKEKGEKNIFSPNAVCEECFTIKIYGDNLPIKIYGDNLPTQIYGGNVPIKIYGDRLPIKITWGPFSNIVYKNLHTQKISTMHGMRTGVHSTLYIWDHVSQKESI